MLVHEGITQEQYEDVVRRLTDGKGLQSPASWPVEGLLVHASGQGPDGFRVVDVWESEEAVQSFGEKIGPLFQEAGIESEPTFYPAHTFIKA